jgi:hypothetical protein
MLGTQRLRLRKFFRAGRLAHSARQRVVHLPEHAPWVVPLQVLTALRGLTAPD